MKLQVVLCVVALAVVASVVDARTHVRHKQRNQQKWAFPRFEEPAAEAETNTEAAAEADGGSVTAASKEEAEAKCKNAVQEGMATPEEEAAELGATTGADSQETAEPGSTQPCADGKPCIAMPDGTLMHLPSACSPLGNGGGAPGTPGAGGGEVPGVVVPGAVPTKPPPELIIPAGIPPCGSCPGDGGIVREIQVLQYVPGKARPLVLGKQLLSENKTQQMVHVVTGKLDEELAKEEEAKAKVEAIHHQAEVHHEAKVEQMYQSQVTQTNEEHEKNKVIEASLSEALKHWGIAETYGKEEHVSDEEAELEAAAETVEAEGSAEGEVEVEAEAAAE